VHISVGGPVDQLSAENVAMLAPKLGVERVTYISGATVAEKNRHGSQWWLKSWMPRKPSGILG
jgi:hypothetical protein